MKALLSLLAFSAPALAQSPIVGFAYNGDTFEKTSFTTTTDDFVGNYVASGPHPAAYREFDLDASATTAYSFIHANSHIGTLDLTTGVVSTFGPSGIPPGTMYGLTAHPDGVTWYAMSRSGLNCQLYRGNMVANSFVPVGPIHPGHAFMNLACDGLGRLFSIDAGDDSLYQINAISGALTLKGSLGLDVNYTHGLDFDWSTGWLHACILTTIAAESYFVRLDPADGAILDAQDTLVFGSQMRMAIARPAPLVPLAFDHFCDPANPNSTGSPCYLNANPYAGAGAGVHLDAINGPPHNLGYFLVGSGFTEPGIDVSFGRLCLATTAGNVIGRYTVLGSPMNGLGVFNAFGTMVNIGDTSTSGFGFDVPLSLPLIGSPIIMAGESWCFQVWYRDYVLPGSASNFSNGVRVSF